MAKVLSVSLEEKKRVVTTFRNMLYKKAKEMADSREKSLALKKAEKNIKEGDFTEDELQEVQAFDEVSKTKIANEFPLFLAQQEDIPKLLEFFAFDSLEDLMLLHEILQDETHFKQLMAELLQPLYSYQRTVCDLMPDIRNILIATIALTLHEKQQEEQLKKYIQLIQKSDLSVTDQRERLELAYDCLATLQDQKIRWAHHSTTWVSRPISENPGDSNAVATGAPPLRERLTIVYGKLRDNQKLLTEKVSPSVKTIIFTLIQTLSSLLQGEKHAPKTDFFASNRIGQNLVNATVPAAPSKFKR